MPLKPSKVELDSIVQALLPWFLKHRRQLPWRPADPHSLRDPYSTWVSETMLQQTRVESVITSFKQWMQKFPTVHHLAKAQEEEVLSMWQGLGYYSRAKNLHKAASQLSNNMTISPQFPTSRQEWVALPGIGDYAAGAILSLALHQKEAILDGNLIRVFSRLFKIQGDPTKDSNVKNQLWNLAREFANHSQPYLINEALMEFGALQCTPKKVLCQNCPLSDMCQAYASDQVHEFPQRLRKSQKVFIYGTAWLVEKSGKYLFVKSKSGLLANQWRIPWTTHSAELLHPSTPQIKHQITHHKIILAVKKQPYSQSNLPIDPNESPLESTWLTLTEARKIIANSLSLKALRFAEQL